MEVFFEFEPVFVFGFERGLDELWVGLAFFVVEDDVGDDAGEEDAAIEPGDGPVEHDGAGECGDGEHERCVAFDDSFFDCDRGDDCGDGEDEAHVGDV